MENLIKNLLFRLKSGVIEFLRLLGWGSGDTISKIHPEVASDNSHKSLEDLQSKIIHSIVEHHVFAPPGSLLFLSSSFMRKQRRQIAIT